MTQLPSAHHPRRRAASLPVLLSVPHSGRDYPDWLVELASARPSGAGDARGSAGRPAGWRAIAARRRRGHRPRAARGDRLQPRRGRDRPVGHRRRPARARSAPARAAGSGIVPARTQQHGTCGGGRSRAAQLERAARPGPPALSPRDRGSSSRCCSTGFGCALLLDCHSMPPPPAGSPPVVIGDRRGRSAERLAQRDAVRDRPRCGLRRPASTTRSPAGMSSSATAARRAASTRSSSRSTAAAYLDATLSAPGPGFDHAAC